MNSFRFPLIALAVYVTAYFLIRMAGVLYYDRYGFFRASYFGRYHIAPSNCDSATSPSMLAWYAFLPVHVVEHYGRIMAGVPSYVHRLDEAPVPSALAITSIAGNFPLP